MDLQGSFDRWVGPDDRLKRNWAVVRFALHHPFRAALAIAPFGFVVWFLNYRTVLGGLATSGLMAAFVLLLYMPRVGLARRWAADLLNEQDSFGATADNTSPKAAERDPSL